MLLQVCLVTRNKAITVTTLHMLLQLAGRCYQRQDHQLAINFVEDTKPMVKFIRQGERVLWVDYACSLDPDSFEHVFDPMKGRDVLIFPTVTEGIDWNRFRKNVGSKESVNQIGLNFDTEVGSKISDGIWTVTRSNPKVFVVNGSAVEKKTRQKKGEGLRLPRDVDLIFEKFKECDVKMHAWTKANVLVLYTHECVGNILEANGVRVQS